MAVAFFGDGAVNQAYFHECLNFAAVEALPAVFVCENNWYGEFTPMQKVTGGVDIAGRAAAYGIPGAAIDGNDLWAVIEATRAAVERARGGGGPTLLEMQTYRHYGHSKSDPATYRPKGELESWLERDPLKLTRERLRGQRGGDRGGRGGGAGAAPARGRGRAGGAVPGAGRRRGAGVRGMSGSRHARHRHVGPRSDA